MPARAIVPHMHTHVATATPAMRAITGGKCTQRTHTECKRAMMIVVIVVIVVCVGIWDVVVVCVGIGDVVVWVLRIGDNIRPYLCWTIEMKIFLLVEHSEILL
tara:strand:+ start:255 stop:563 length:309 start_codon:yes stop_codon:yes gene_type:complete